MNQNKSVHRTLVILNLPRRVPALITYTQSVITAMTNNPHFPTPTPALGDVSTVLAALQTAESVALTRVKGAVVARNDKKAAVITLLQQLRGYIQNVADAEPARQDHDQRAAGRLDGAVPVSLGHQGGAERLEPARLARREEIGRASCRERV